MASASDHPTTASGPARFAVPAARILLGLVFTVFGLNGFLHFIPQPPIPGVAGELLGAMAATGYFFPVLKGLEVAAGLMLLSGRLVPLALVLLAPVIVQIALFHFVLTPGQVGMAIGLLALELFLAWAYRDSFRGVLAVHARPRLVAGDGAGARAPRQAAAT